MTGVPNIYNSFIQKFNQCSPSFGVDNITACFEHTWIDNNTYTSSYNSAVYTLISQSSTGCDSIVTLNLVIDTVNTQIENNNSILSSLSNQAIYQWINWKVTHLLKWKLSKFYSNN